MQLSFPYTFLVNSTITNKGSKFSYMTFYFAQYDDAFNNFTCSSEFYPTGSIWNTC